MFKFIIENQFLKSRRDQVALIGKIYLGCLTRKRLSAQWGENWGHLKTLDTIVVQKQITMIVKIEGPLKLLDTIAVQKKISMSVKTEDPLKPLDIIVVKKKLQQTLKPKVLLSPSIP